MIFNNTPMVLNLETFVDDRGVLSFSNKLNLSSVKRFYTVKNFQKNFIRAWHAHKKESKIFILLEGAFLISCVKIDNWKKPSKKNKVYKFFTSDENKKIIFVPPSYANGFMSLRDDSTLLILSNRSVSESTRDDCRFDPHYWSPWNISER